MLALVDTFFEAPCCFEFALELAAGIFDVVAWRKSRPNRIARQEARQSGETPPPMTGWAMAFVILLIVLIILIAIRVAVIIARWQS